MKKMLTLFKVYTMVVVLWLNFISGDISIIIFQIPARGIHTNLLFTIDNE